MKQKRSRWAFKEKKPDKICVIVAKDQIENKKIVYVVDSTYRTLHMGKAPQFHNPIAAKKKMRDWGLSEKEYVIQSIRFGEAAMAMIVAANRAGESVKSEEAQLPPGAVG